MRENGWNIKQNEKCWLDAKVPPPESPSLGERCPLQHPVIVHHCPHLPIRNAPLRTDFFCTVLPPPLHPLWFIIECKLWSVGYIFSLFLSRRGETTGCSWRFVTICDHPKWRTGVPRVLSHTNSLMLAHSRHQLAVKQLNVMPTVYSHRVSVPS